MCTHSTAHYPHYTTHFYLLFPFFLTGSLTVVVYFCVCIFHLVYSGTTYNFDLSCVQPAKGKGVATYFAQELDDTGDSSDYFYYLSLFGLPDKEFGTCLFVWLFRLFDCLAFRWLHVTGTFFWVEGGRMAITVYNKVQGKKNAPHKCIALHRTILSCNTRPYFPSDLYHTERALLLRGVHIPDTARNAHCKRMILT